MEENDSEVGVDRAFSTHPVDQKPAVFETRQNALDLLRLAFMPQPPHGSKHGHRVVFESLDDRCPFLLLLLQSLLGLSQGHLLLGREFEHGRRERIYRLLQRKGQRRLLALRRYHGRSSTVLRICPISSRSRPRSAFASCE